ncbi:uncharacterized protein LOC117180673 [Belonocnema kinseyi]|uniref:uncharacterized protein LOC117180673 n=1 Tax=Belonocnema kinseyi TaxID=2817044 RepID=UPI00143DED6D|nr:uncharacterized protein LOC117180673 [Belonocnema kinseyi]
MRESSSITPVRVVFNASSPTSSEKSLNDLFMVGPKLQNEVTAVILQWRYYRFGMTADISKMFHQILVDTKDLDLQRIVCLRGPSRQLVEYQSMTVSYGMTSALFLANRVLKQLAEAFLMSVSSLNEILRRRCFIWVG